MYVTRWTFKTTVEANFCFHSVCCLFEFQWEGLWVACSYDGAKHLDPVGQVVN